MQISRPVQSRMGFLKMCIRDRIMKLFFTPDEQLEDKKITDFFDDEVLNSNFWLYWRTMFAFENWHSALETVSYTHLDVYKRQLLLMVGGSAFTLLLGPDLQALLTALAG